MKSCARRWAVLLGVMAVATLSMAGIHAAAQDSEPIRLPMAEGVELKEGEGRDTVMNNCLACHSAKPIVTHDGFTDEVWAAEVDKMITRYGADISDEDAEIIIRYLQTHYSDEPPSSDDVLLFGLDNALATPRAAEAEAGASPVATPASDASD